MLKLDGTKVSAAIRAELRLEAQKFASAHGRKAGLGVLLVGENPASQVYVRNKLKACVEVGLEPFQFLLPAQATTEQLRAEIEKLNQHPLIDGYLVQMPLPGELAKVSALEWISPRKDADALTPSSLGRLWAGQALVTPCTPAGVMEILSHYQIHLAGRHAVVVGRSHIVGRPMAELLLAANATVTICHSQTKNLRQYTREADLVVVAAGQKELLGREDFKAGSVVVDVGIHRVPQADGATKIVGDVRFDELEGWVRAATPVPGGVGPMTITMLLKNTLTLAKISR